MATVTPGVVMPINSQQWAVNNYVAAPTTPYSGTFIPTLWSGKLAKKFYETALFPGIANTDWQGEISGIGDTVIINTIPDVEVREYKVGQNLQYDVMSPKTIDLKIDEGNYFGLNVNDVMEHQAKPNLMNMFTREASYQMAKYVDHRGLEKVLFDKTTGLLKVDSEAEKTIAKISCFNVGATAGAESGSYNLGTDAAPLTIDKTNIVSLITKLSSVLDEANIPEEGRFLVISPLERQMLLESPIAQAYFTGDSTSPLRNGMIGKIDRFSIYVCNHLPRAAAGKAWVKYTPEGGTETDTADGAAKRHIILAGTKAGMSFASQITKVENLQNPSDFGQLVRGLNVWGAGITQGEALSAAVIAG